MEAFMSKNNNKSTWRMKKIKSNIMDSWKKTFFPLMKDKKWTNSNKTTNKNLKKLYHETPKIISRDKNSVH